MPLDVVFRDVGAGETPSVGPLLCRAAGFVGGSPRPVEIWLAPPGILLRVQGGADFYIPPNGKSAQRIGKQPQPLQGLDAEIFFGPAIALALALRGVWPLHASAVQRNGKTIAFLGESGQGKSTLAAFLFNAGWMRVSDDILPVSGGADGAVAWPHFPQLKLPPEQQPALTLPETLPLHALCLLQAAPPDQTMRLDALTAGETVAALLAHTAATRLFPPDLLSAHLAFCASLAPALSAYRLVYPHHLAALPQVMESLEALC